MEWVETTGRTVEEAKEAALDQLGVDHSDAEFVVVSEPKAGLFGRMRGEARVRARVRPTSPRPKRTRSRRQGEQREGTRRSAGAARGGSGARGRSANGGGSAVAVAADSESPSAATASGNGAGSGRSRSRRSRGRGRSGGSGQGSGASRSAEAGANGAAVDGDEGEARPARDRAGARGARTSGSAKEEAVGEALSLEEQGETARAFVAGLVDELGLDATVSTRMLDDETVEVAVDGSELGPLVGPGGATLAALQELARTFVQKRTGGQSSRILVDVAGYRAKRAAALQRFTRQIAEEVLASGSDRSLEPMSAADRKVVHDTVNDIEGLSTRSEGEDPRRYIVISPTGATTPEPVAGSDDAEPDDGDEPAAEASTEA